MQVLVIHHKSSYLKQKLFINLEGKKNGKSLENPPKHKKLLEDIGHHRHELLIQSFLFSLHHHSHCKKNQVFAHPQHICAAQVGDGNIYEKVFATRVVWNDYVCRSFRIASKK